MAQSYGRFLTWLDSKGLLDRDATPAARATPGNLKDYIITTVSELDFPHFWRVRTFIQ